MDIKDKLATNILQLRQSHNMTQADLAEALDMSLDMVGRMERATIAPSFKTLEKLCSVLRVDVVELFGTGVSAGLRTNRTKVLHEINRLLSHMTDDELEKAKKLIQIIR